MGGALKVEVRSMGLQDVDILTFMIQKEGWEFDRSDIERILHIDPDNSIIASVDGKIIGGITVCSMGPWALLGHVLVDIQHRKMGAGQRLMDDVLRKLDSSGVRTVEVFGESRAASFYRRNGFRFIEECAIFEKDLGEGEFSVVNDYGIRRYEPKDMDGLLRIDRSIVRFDRSKIINAFISSFPRLAHVSSVDGELTGYVLARSSPIGNDVGPLISLDGSAEAALRLLQSALSVLPGGATYVIGPTENAILNDIMKETGFAQKQKLVRMIRSTGDITPYPPEMLAISATEYG